MPFKTAPVQVKAIGEAGGLAAGQFRAVVSVFGNIDCYGDRVVKGAFAKTLEEWKASGNPIPVLYSHNDRDPDFNIGYVIEATETDEGLEVLAQLDVDSDTGRAKQVSRLLNEKRVTQFSFMYDVRSYQFVPEEGRDWDVMELTDVKLYEVGPCLIGANDQTRLIGSKAARDELADVAAHQLSTLARNLKAGRTLSAANEAKIASARDELDGVLASLEKDDATKAAPSAEVKAETFALPTDGFDLLEAELHVIDCD